MNATRKSAGKKKQPRHGGGDILLLSDDDLARELVSRLGEKRLFQVAEPYEALWELSRRDCSAVILAAPQEDLAGLGRAIRRLNSRARLMAVSRPEDIDEVRRSLDGITDDCCTLPPTRGELNLLLRGRDGPQGPAGPTVLSAGAICELITATKSFDAMEKRIAGVICDSLGSEVKWVLSGQCPPGAEPLLSLSVSGPRVLVADPSIRIDPATDALIGELQRLIPALQATAGRIQSLHRLAITDHLTGAYNRRYFYHLADHILKRAENEDLRAALLLYDIDDFKRYNDKFGHAAGDEILRDTATLIRQITRRQDIVARIGGDEFAVLFWDDELRKANSQPLRDAWDLADRFRKAVEHHDFISLGSGARGTLTISGGLANFPEHGRECMELLRQADRALREAKESGKNSIHLVGHGAGAR